MPKISALTQLNTPADNDVIAVGQISSTTTKKLTLLGLATGYLQGLATWVTTNMLATGAATTAKVKLNIINYTAPQSGSYTNATTTWTDILSVNYTSGATPERLFIEGGSLCNQTTSGSGKVRLQVNGVASTRCAYTDANPNRWENLRVFDTFDIPANTTVAIKLQGKVDTGTITASFGGPDASTSWGPHITGYAMSN